MWLRGIIGAGNVQNATQQESNVLGEGGDSRTTPAGNSNGTEVFVLYSVDQKGY